jgi:hypothetical protein
VTICFKVHNSQLDVTVPRFTDYLSLSIHRYWYSTSTYVKSWIFYQAILLDFYPAFESSCLLSTGSEHAEKRGYVTSDIIFPTAIIKNTNQLTTYPPHDGRPGIQTINNKRFTPQQITLTKQSQKDTRHTFTIRIIYRSTMIWTRVPWDTTIIISFDNIITCSS